MINETKITVELKVVRERPSGHVVQSGLGVVVSGIEEDLQVSRLQELFKSIIYELYIEKYELSITRRETLE